MHKSFEEACKLSFTLMTNKHYWNSWHIVSEFYASLGTQLMT